MNAAILPRARRMAIGATNFIRTTPTAISTSQNTQSLSDTTEAVCAVGRAFFQAFAVACATCVQVVGYRFISVIYGDGW